MAGRRKLKEIAALTLSNGRGGDGSNETNAPDLSETVGAADRFAGRRFKGKFPPAETVCKPFLGAISCVCERLELLHGTGKLIFEDRPVRALSGIKVQRRYGPVWGLPSRNWRRSSEPN